MTAAERGYGPSLPELVAPRLRALGRWQRVALLGLLAIFVAASAALLIRQEAAVETYRQEEPDARRRGLAPIGFHFDYSNKLRLSRPPGTYVRLERRQGRTLASRFTVSELRLGR